MIERGRTIIHWSYNQKFELLRKILRTDIKLIRQLTVRVEFDSIIRKLFVGGEGDKNSVIVE